MNCQPANLSDLLKSNQAPSAFRAVSAITATLDVEDDVTAVVVNILLQFPKGARVKLITEVPPATPVPGVEEYRCRMSEGSAQSLEDHGRRCRHCGNTRPQ